MIQNHFQSKLKKKKKNNWYLSKSIAEAINLVFTPLERGVSPFHLHYKKMSQICPYLKKNTKYVINVNVENILLTVYIKIVILHKKNLLLVIRLENV